MKKRTRRKLRIDAALMETQTPAFLLDRSRRIVLFNSGCAALTGWNAEEVVGVVCEYQSESAAKTVEALAASICPPPEVFTGDPVAVAADLAHRDGKSTARLLSFFPLLDADGSVEAVLGIATDIAKPLPPARVTLARQLHAELAALRSGIRQRFGRAAFVGRGEAMQRVQRQIQLAINGRSPILLLGEPGTGKEHVARLIHNESEQRGGAFVPVDCRDLPTREIKNILRRLFDPDPSTASLPALRPSTLFLSHVDSLARDVQEMLVEQFAGHETESGTTVRLMAATTQPFSDGLESESIRSDFYYLMTSLEITLPALRARADEIDLLAQLFLESANRGSEQQVGGFTPAVSEQFRQYRWPGNLDELRAVVAEARKNCTNTSIDVGDLPFRFRTGIDSQSVGPPVTPAVVPLEEHLAAVEAEHIRSALEQVRDNKTRAAKLLGLTRARLYRRMEALGIEDPDESES